MAFMLGKHLSNLCSSHRRRGNVQISAPASESSTQSRSFGTGCSTNHPPGVSSPHLVTRSGKQHSVIGAGEITVELSAEAIFHIHSESKSDAELLIDLSTETSIQLNLTSL